MTTTRFLSRRPALLLAVLLLAAAPALQAADEGIDPMRQITEQMDAANFLIVQDVTGSMRWDFKGNTLSYQENSTGNLFWNSGCYYTGGCDDGTGNADTASVLNKYWGIGNRLVPQYASSDCSSGNCRVWTYVLLFERPSRLALVKNALGNHVSIVDSYLPPPYVTAGDPGYYSWTTTTSNTAFRADWRTPPAAAKVETFAFDPADQTRIQFWVYTIDYGYTGTYWDPCCTRDWRGNCQGCQKPAPNRKPNPGLPFNGAITAANNRPALNAAGDGCFVGTCKPEPPKRVIDLNKDRVNWGLLTYSNNNSNKTDGKVRVYDVDPRGGNPNLTNILNSYRLNQRSTEGWSVSDGHNLGLIANGGTNTRPALWRTTNDSDTNKGANNSLTRSRKLYSTCPAPYGVLLVTDGQSNDGNDPNGSWSKCPAGAAGFPAGSAHNLYSLFNQSPRVNTWAIGISEDVGACELNFTAYSGRTDANSPRGDAGYSGYAAQTDDDPGNPYVAEAAVGIGDAAFDDHYDTSHGSNAFFPKDSEALREAIMAIVNATAVGDYTTGAPVSGGTAGKDSIVYLPSTEFPSWRGQFYAFDTTREQFLDPPTNKVPNPDYEIWNAADKLNARASSERKIFTWTLASSGKTYDLVEVTTGNLATLQAIAGTAALTANVVDYVRGNDGSLTGKARSWKLGPVINSTPAIVASPEKWTQGNVPSHTDLERITRDALLFVGSNSGMMHAFRVVDGEEQIALLPPSLLARQIDLYQNYLDSKKFRPSGQLPDPAQHLYGVANSLRFGDVRIGKDYRTVGLVTLGPGGEEIAAIDITKVPRPDANPYNNPVTVLWSKTDAELAGLGTTWSIPAMAPTMKGTASNDDGKWRLLLGSGFDAASTAETQKDSTNYTPPRAFSLDVATGDLLQTKALSTTTGATHTNFVGNQAFADVVLFDPTAPSYKPDNIALMGVQADLNGRLWFLWTPSSSSLYNFSGDPVKGVDTTTLYGVNQSQPFYYNPAASGYGAYNKVDGTTGQEKVGCAAYAFGSGSLYEKSEAVTGPRVGEAGYFIPRVYVATSEKPDVTSGYKLTASPTALTDSQIWQRAIAGDWCVKDCENADPTKRTYKKLGLASQLTAPPFLLAPKDDTQSITALFLVYDPEEGCDGNSYVLQVDFKGIGASCSLRDNQGNFDVEQKAFNAGAGAASGFTIAGTQVLVAQSGVGEGQRAKLYVPEGLAASLSGGVEPRVRWWKELK
ncbi:MAG: pilus assembly protein [Thermoanaerobaculia bacterium]